MLQCPASYMPLTLVAKILTFQMTGVCIIVGFVADGKVMIAVQYVVTQLVVVEGAPDLVCAYLPAVRTSAAEQNGRTQVHPHLFWAKRAQPVPAMFVSILMVSNIM